MKSINKVFLVGHLGQDPELKTSKNGKLYARLNIATNRSYKDENGKNHDSTSWHRVTAWGQKREICMNALKKGSPVVIEGYLSTFEIPGENGQKQTKTFITADQVSILGKKAGPLDPETNTEADSVDQAV